MNDEFYDIGVRHMNGTEEKLSAYQGKVLLIVNVASKCGLTPQYDGLENLYRLNKDKGFVVLGFPANDFAAQEPGSNAEIAEFCRLTYGVEFPVLEKIVVKGEGQHPLYKYLTTAKPDAQQKEGSQLAAKLASKGLLGAGAGEIMWNFEKFLIGKEGAVVARFAPDVTPEDDMITKAIEAQLK